MDQLDFWAKWGLVIIGVIISVILPILIAAIKKAFPQGNAIYNVPAPLWDVARPYLLLGLFSIVIGLFLALVIPMETVATAVLTGFAWDKTVQTIRDGGKNPAAPMKLVRPLR
jgi:formate hydrogenlyase subunit 3/multisubunit Na+/H+ antiporter MnhD subunit